MGVKVGSFSPGTTGNVSVSNLSFLPTNLIVRLGAPTSVEDTGVTARCDGWCTASNQSYDSHFQDSTGRKQKAGTDKVILHYKRVSGTITERVVATFVSFDDNGGGNYGFTLNFSAVDANYQVRYIASDA